MVRRSGVDDVLQPHQFESLFEKAATIKDPVMAVLLSFLLVIPGRLGPRNAEVLHTCEDYVIRNYKGEIVGYQIPTGLDCSDQCNVCQSLAKQAARDADDEDAHWTDFIHRYWSPKSHAGGRKIPVLTERQSELIDLYLEYVDETPPMGKQTYRNRLLRLEEVCDAVDVNLYPQALRATAVNNVVLRGMNPADITSMMGWKYISTAVYYITKSDHRLRMAMQNAYNRDAEVPYRIYDYPPTFSEVRRENDLWELEQLTPERYRETAEDDEDPLERHAQNSIKDTTISDWVGSADENQGQVGPALIKSAANAIDWVGERGVEIWDKVVQKPFFATLEKTQRRKQVSGTIMIALTLLASIGLIGTTEAVNLGTGTVTITPAAAFAVTVTAFVYAEILATLLGVDLPGHIDLLPETWKFDPDPDA